MSDLVPLQFLASGESGHVHDVVGDAGAVGRLAEMGVRSGAAVTMVRQGSPCIIRLADGKYCMRDADTFHVLVQVAAV